MYEGRYVGPLAHLKGKEALLQPEQPLGPAHKLDDSPRYVHAQFSDYDARRDGVDLSHGWHRFKETDFERIV